MAQGWGVCAAGCFSHRSLGLHLPTPDPVSLTYPVGKLDTVITQKEAAFPKRQNSTLGPLSWSIIQEEVFSLLTHKPRCLKESRPSLTTPE